MARKGFYFDMTKCIGCRTCQIACKDVNGLEVGTLFRHVASYEVGTYPNARMYHYASSCNHCENPACVEVCPVGAMYVDEEDGTIQHDDSICIGCKTCVAACPYTVPQFVEELGIVQKCSLCKSLRDNGEEPACVSSCLTRALEWGDIDELRERHPDAVSDIAVLPPSETTLPSVLVMPKEAAFEADYRPFAI